MRIDIGPVSRESAQAWLDYARGALEALREYEPARAPDAVISAFGELLEEWTAIASEPQDFHWVADRPADQVEYLVNALYEAGVAIEARHEVGGADLRPPEADEFHFAVVNQVLAALVQEGEAYRQFVEMLRGEWGVAGT